MKKTASEKRYLFNYSQAIKLLSPLISIIIALLISGFFVLWAKNMPVYHYFQALSDLMKILISESFGTPQKMMEVLVYTSPLLFCGLAHIIAFKCGLFNIGVEGQFIIGMIVAAVIGQITGISSIIHQLLIIIIGIIFAGLWGGIQGYLKAKRGTNEVVVGIMMNFIAMYLGSYIALRTALCDHTANATFTIQPSAQLPAFTGYSRANISILIALIIVVFVYLLLDKSKKGFQIRSVGLNAKAAELGGINVSKNVIFAMALSGAIAGLGGLMHVTGVQLRLTSMVVLPGYGFDAIAVALLANKNPFACIFSALLFGAFKASSRIFQLNGIPKEIVYIIQAVIIILVVIDLFGKRFRKGKV